MAEQHLRPTDLDRGRAALPRRPNFHQNERSDVLACAYPHGFASIAALAGGEIGANRQVCPTIVGDCVELHTLFSVSRSNNGILTSIDPGIISPHMCIQTSTDSRLLA